MRSGDEPSPRFAAPANSGRATSHVIIHQKLCLCRSFLLPIAFSENDFVDSEDATRELDVS
jgi:hypothetical protein